VFCYKEDISQIKSLKVAQITNKYFYLTMLSVFGISTLESVKSGKHFGDQIDLHSFRVTFKKFITVLDIL